MPLRKQDELPKLPKTRKKTIDKVKSATPTFKKDEVEYHLSVFYKYDAILKKQFYVLSIKTIKEFSNLAYEISVDVRKEKDVIDISLLGLNTKQSYFVQPSPAITDLYFEDLFGKFTVNLIKQDGSINSGIYEFNVYKKEVTLLEEFMPIKKNNRKFCTFGLTPELNTFKE